MILDFGGAARNHAPGTKPRARRLPRGLTSHAAAPPKTQTGERLPIAPALSPRAIRTRVSFLAPITGRTARTGSSASNFPAGSSRCGQPTSPTAARSLINPSHAQMPFSDDCRDADFRTSEPTNKQAKQPEPPHASEPRWWSGLTWAAPSGPRFPETQKAEVL